MQKKTITLILMFLVTLLNATVAQKLTVEGMAASPMDLSASQYERKDLAGQPCGLVKVQLAAMGAKFEGNVVGQTEYKTGEYWVYMTEGSYMLTVKHPSFVPLDINFRDYGISGVTGKSTYKLILLMPNLTGVPVDDGMRYLVMTVEPANATVYVDNALQPVQDGTVSILLPMGTHSYRVEAPAYEAKSGTVNIGTEKLTLPIRLESAMATLSVNGTTHGTQIYVNEQLKGTTSWTGTLPAGSYRVEGRLQGYRSHRQNVTLQQRQQHQLTIPALQAITGVLNVNYKPANAEVWIDGKKAGTSPDIFRNILVGSHSVELRAGGYTSKQERVTIEEGKTAMLAGALERQQAMQSSAASLPSTATTTSGAAIETFTVNGVSFNMVRVDGGTFTMGATSEQGNDAYDWEKPVHQVTLSTYSIGETEVTQELWQAVMGSNPSNFKGNNRPVENVSWDDCQIFVQKLNQVTGRRFRLPTEAEWEYAACGGSKSRGYKYSGSNNIDEVAWYTKTTNDNGTRDVKTKKANELGLYDMSGNVWEWCQDWYGSYSSNSQMNPTGPSSGSNRVGRGGSWYYGARNCRSSCRNYLTPSNRNNYFGLRLAL